MTTVLELAQTVSGRLENQIPSTFYANTNQDTIYLRYIMEEAGKNLVQEFEWVELQKEHTFTLATDTASYALPSDFNAQIFHTLWNRTQRWPLLGPVDPVLWQEYKSGLVTTLPRQRFRVKGWSLTQFFIDPTPSSSENGQTCVFEYISKTWLKPKTWIASTSWSGIRYCSYNGYIFDRGSTGAATTGTSAPTPSSLNDGSITWTLYSDPYATIISDTDQVILDAEMLAKECVWRFKKGRKLDYMDYKTESDEYKAGAKTNLSGAQVVSFNNRGLRSPMIGPWSYPDGNYYGS